MTAVVYTDASYCHKTDVAACGFAVLLNGRFIKHQVFLVGGLETSTKSEVFALVEGLQFAFMQHGVTHIQANTDCKTIVECIGKKRFKKHETYFDLNETILMIQESGIGFMIKHVKAHRGNRMNNLVDRSCNKQLKTYLKKKAA